MLTFPTPSYSISGLNIQKYYFSQLISRCGNWGRLLSIVSIAADNWNIFAIAASVILRWAGSQFPVMCVTAECELAGARVIIIWSVLRALWAPGRGRWLMIYSLPNNWSQIWTPPGSGKCPRASLLLSPWDLGQLHGLESIDRSFWLVPFLGQNIDF